MPNVNAAYPMIKGSLKQLCQDLMSFPQSPFWIHETVLSNYIGIPRGKGKHGQGEALTTFLAAIKRGYGVQKKSKEVITIVAATDLESKHNDLGICYQKWGDKEEFARGDLSEEPKTIFCSDCWFHFGKNFSIQVSQQMNIVQNLTGNCRPGIIDESYPAMLPMYQIR